LAYRLNGILLRDGRFKQSLGEDWTCQTFGNHKRIVAKRGKKFAQHFGLLGMTGHALHLGL